MISIPAVFMLLLGFLFLFIGLDFIFAPTLFKCDRLRDICYRESRHIWSKQPKTEKLCALSDIEQVRVKASYGGNNTSTMYQVVLELKNGDSMSIFNSSSSVKSQHEKDAEEINKFLKYGPLKYEQNELSIKDSFLLGGIIFLVFGIIIICMGGGMEIASRFIENIDWENQ